MNTLQDIPEFGLKRPNEERRDGGCGVIFDPATQLYAVGIKKSGLIILFSGGVNDGEDIEAAILREVTEESGLHNFTHVEKIAEAITHFHNTSKNVDRMAHATCLLVILKNRDVVPTKLEAHEDFSLLWKTPEEILENWHMHNANKDHDHWIYFLKKSVNRAIELGYDTTQPPYE